VALSVGDRGSPLSEIRTPSVTATIFTTYGRPTFTSSPSAIAAFLNMSQAPHSRAADQDMKSLHSLKVALVSRSDRACPCFWTPGSCGDPDLADGFARLTEAELHAWGRLSATAALLELDATQPLSSATDDLRKGLVALFSSINDEDRQRLAAALAAPASVSLPEEGNFRL
jgi:hypothetical protein